MTYAIITFYINIRKLKKKLITKGSEELLIILRHPACYVVGIIMKKVLFRNCTVYYRHVLQNITSYNYYYHE